MKWLTYTLRRLHRLAFGPIGGGHCLGCNARLTRDELRYYHSTCERCEARWYRATYGDSQ